MQPAGVMSESEIEAAWARIVSDRARREFKRREWEEERRASQARFWESVLLPIEGIDPTRAHSICRQLRMAVTEWNEIAKRAVIEDQRL